MEQQILKQSAEYNELVGDVFSKVEFSTFRNTPHLLWMKRGAMNLKEAIDNLLEINTLTPKERKFLVEIKKVIDSHLRNHIVRIERNKAKEILILSIDAVIERDKITMNDVLDGKDYKSFKEAVFLLEANSRLLEFVKVKLKNLNIEKEDVLNIQKVSKSLIKTYLFLTGEIEKEFLLDSMNDIRETWRYYHPLSEILVN